MASLSFGNIYGNLYHSFEIPGSKIYFHREVHHGLVLITENNESPRPARLELTHESLSVQVPVNFSGFAGANLEQLQRTVTLNRDEDGGLGLSIKGGSDGTCKVPIMISKIFEGKAAEKTGELFIGDAIIEVNGINVENFTHEEVVKLLKDGGQQVQLLVNHNSGMAPYMKTGSLGRSRGKLNVAAFGYGSLGRNMRSANSTLKSEKSKASSTANKLEKGQVPKGWEVMVKIPLAMAYVTRYLWGTDKMRPKGFEVQSVDGTSTGVIQCEDVKIVDDWVTFICANIMQLNTKTINISNKYLPPQDLIVYLGWVAERNENKTAGEFYQNWEPLFLILKGTDVCFYDSPPLNNDELSKRCRYSYKIMETAIRIVKSSHLLDQRKHCFTLETSDQTKHYFSLESRDTLYQLESAWHRSTYYAVQKEQNRSYPCTFDGKPSALTLSVNGTVSLYDIHSKVYLWKKKFSQLKTSTDDGHMRIQMVFRTKNDDEFDMKEVDTSQLYQFIFGLHSFMIARLLSLDPDFLKSQQQQQPDEDTSKTESS